MHAQAFHLQIPRPSFYLYRLNKTHVSNVNALQLLHTALRLTLWKMLWDIVKDEICNRDWKVRA